MMSFVLREGVAKLCPCMKLGGNLSYSPVLAIRFVILSTIH